MKKKFLFLLFITILVGCQDQSVYQSYNHEEKDVEQQEDTVSPNVTVHGYSGIGEGYVIKKDGRNKWLLSLANIVSGHPYAMIQTSENKEIQAEVVAINKESNIAILKINNSANITPYTISDSLTIEETPKVGEIIVDEKQNIQGIVSFIHQNDRFVEKIIPSTEIEELLLTAEEDPLTYKERLALIPYFEKFPSEKIDNSVFDVNSDQLLSFIDEFHAALNSYINDGKEEYRAFIGNDELLQHFEETKSTKIQFSKSTFKSINYYDYQYIVELETTIKEGQEETKVTEIIRCILVDQQWKIISFQFQQ
ncbi:hypothetical protein SAMN05880501_11643 [Ureibacillus xyleni]|uniref:Lipoprotein n=1 Tax=Ureibacillus xyleni TaxID=614648 RepID=A0A285TS99_9BACL|nr:hypothetical protein [Ureibacillus xyleni]SOC23929.1 hypothetical protein SAMN05880501_11643 [Ureibacillus xyleni]